MPLATQKANACNGVDEGYSAIDEGHPERIRLDKRFKSVRRRKERLYIAAKATEVCDLAVTDACIFWRRYRQRKATPTQISAEQFRASFAALLGDANSSVHSSLQHALQAPPLCLN